MFTEQDVFVQSVKADTELWEFKKQNINEGLENHPVEGFQWIKKDGQIKALIGGYEYNATDAKAYLESTLK